MLEKKAFKFSGIIGLEVSVILIVLTVISIKMFQENENVALLVLGVLSALLSIVNVTGIVIIQPNSAKVLTIFGHYVGVIKDSGLWWTIPLTVSKNVPLRVISFTTPVIKVNDVQGNPIEIGTVVVYKVIDPTKAVFDVEDYTDFVRNQSETGLRHIAKYPYDDFNTDYNLSLRQHSDEVSEELKNDLQTRLEIAGLEIMEARIMHLAYSSEIASAMLQRQQAQAVLSARKVIVDGAVSMVKSAIDQLSNEGVVELDEEKKAIMVNNLMVALVSEKGSQPVINTGTIN